MDNVITEERRSKIQELAQQKFENYNLTLPVDPSMLASKLRINVYEGKLNNKKARGVIKKKNNTYTIYIDKNNNIVEKRDTIAHEVGHYFLGHLDNKELMTSLYKEDSKAKDLLEVEANIFSRSLLVPSNFLKRTFEVLTSLKCEANEIVNELALMFKVPEEIILERIEDLKLNI